MRLETAKEVKQQLNISNCLGKHKSLFGVEDVWCSIVQVTGREANRQMNRRLS